MKYNAVTAGAAAAHAIGDAVQPRKAVRFQMLVPVVFRWVDEQGVTQRGAGFTRDISVAGLFVYSATPPPADAVVELEVVLPLNQGTGQGSRLRAPGRVVRVEGSGERSGFAAMSDFGAHNSVVH
jgi:hypothetical protein